MRQYTFDYTILTIRDQCDMLEASQKNDLVTVLGIIDKCAPGIDVWALPATEMPHVCKQFGDGFRRYTEDGMTPDGTRILRDLFKDGNKDTQP